MERGLTESELIELLRSRAPGSSRLRTGIGDDAAISVPGGATATTVDAVVDGVHFRTRDSPPEMIARKAVATALSDLAAMAAEPGEIYVSVGLVRGSEDDFLDRLARGLAESAARYGVALAGGDTVASPVLFLSVTAVGHVASEQELVTRSGAGPGESIALTGEIGGARAGLWLLEQDDREGAGPAVDRLDDRIRRKLIDRQLAPEPLLQTGSALGRAGATAMIDLSDGLITDLGHLATSSAVGIEIDADLLPVAAGVDAVAAAAGRSPAEFVLGGGEDYELALAVPESALEAAVAAAESSGSGLTVIGRTESGPSRVTVRQDGRLLQPAPGYDHLA
ncbi:MAG: thiamine-phosphate kinase [Thermoleophilia bacterium]|nr:thiamine-phosphate kinase [Thermoleophilia bacterium]